MNTFCFLFFKHFKANPFLRPLNLLFPLFGMHLTHLLAHRSHPSGLSSNITSSEQPFLRVYLKQTTTWLLSLSITSPLYDVLHSNHRQHLQMTLFAYMLFGLLSPLPLSPPPKIKAHWGTNFFSLYQYVAQCSKQCLIHSRYLISIC